MLNRTKKQTESSHSSWYKDKFENVRQQRNLLAIIALLSLLASTASVLTVMWMAPYKSVEPFLIQIEEKSGIVKPVDLAEYKDFGADEAIDRYFIARYITARETYVPVTAMLRQNYEQVVIMSDPGIFRDYRAATAQANPDSPAARLSNFGKRTVKFKNISFIERNPRVFKTEKIAQARIRVREENMRDGSAKDLHFVVTIKFGYFDLKLNEEQRYDNPLGYYVTGYEIEAEVV